MTVYKAVSKAPDASKYPHVDRWYRHIASHTDAFATLAGDASAAASTYGPEATADAPAAEEDDDEEVDLFGSDDEEDDAAKEELTKKRLAEYAAKKVSGFDNLELW